MKERQINQQHVKSHRNPTCWRSGQVSGEDRRAFAPALLGSGSRTAPAALSVAERAVVCREIADEIVVRLPARSAASRGALDLAAFDTGNVRHHAASREMVAEVVSAAAAGWL